MPFIDVKLSKSVSESEKDCLKTELGKAISLMHKTESYLMVSISDGNNLYFAGKRLENGAYVAVNVFGKVSPADSENMTGKICEILSELFFIKGTEVYVTYSGIADWGWNGGNF